VSKTLLGWILTFSLLGSAGSVVLAGVFLAFPRQVRSALIPCLLSYAVGTLMGAAFLGLLPQALEKAPPSRVLGVTLSGMVSFFALEKVILWHHCHKQECAGRAGAVGPLILFGDALHNLGDGVVIAAAFLSAVPLGIAASLAIIAHEVPQEVGDFAILLDAGYSRRRALVLNTASGLATVPGALLAYVALGPVGAVVPYVLALSAASFIYIAVADLVPSLHQDVELASGLRQILLVLAGIGTVFWLGDAH